MNVPGKLKNKVGRRFGRLVVLSFVKMRGTTSLWNCKCDCGANKIVSNACLTSGHTKSCGCLWRDVHRTHGMSDTKAYTLWRTMIRRCHEPQNKDYPRYGGRGITVCDKWRKDFAAFYADMGERPDRRQLDRINNNKGYEPGNCRWATDREQQQNRRSNHLITFNGQTKPLIEWARQYGIKKFTLGKRLNKYGWTIEEALTTPTNDPSICKYQLSFFRLSRPISYWSRKCGINRNTARVWRYQYGHDYCAVKFKQRLAKAAIDALRLSDNV